MNNTLLDTVAACSKDLMKFGFSVEEFATLVQENNMTDAEVLAVAKVFEHLKAKKDSSAVDFLLRTSRLPLKVPKTFDNFDFSRITGKNIDKLRNLSTLSALRPQKPRLHWETGNRQNSFRASLWPRLLRARYESILH